MGKRVVTGFLAIAPSVIMIVGIILIYTLKFNADPETMNEPLQGAALVISIIEIALIFLSAIGTWINIIVYIIMAAKNKTFEKTEKISWGIVIYLLNIFIIPVYWYLYVGIQKEEKSYVLQTNEYYNEETEIQV